MKPEPNFSPLILADSHVHLHDCFEPERVLDSAGENFHRVAIQEFNQENFIGVLFLTEVEQANQFEWFRNQLINQQEIKFGKWTIGQTQDNVSLLACSPDSNKKIILIAGHQIVTVENLEVLALLMNKKVKSGLSLEETVEKIASAGGIPVLPWGVGKWIGNRGKVLQKFLANYDSSVFCLGDNGGRPIFWQRPSYFKQAEAKGLRILPGTDPLPLASEYDRPGSFGFAIQGSISLESPGEDIKQILLNAKIPIKAYGSLENPVRFVRNQVAIRLA
jgi:hypothetical protein